MSRALFALPLIALALPAPALAQDVDDDALAVARQLQDPRAQDTLAAALSAMAAAMMEMRIGGVVNAVAKADPDGRTREVDPDMTVADMASRDNPDFQDNLDEDIRGGTRIMGAMAGAMAELLPQLAGLARDVEARVETARDRARRN
ncbi:MAG: hypothetical protein HC788_12310 [Sphingopyxis sp.]|nr:hypothetical protein [Sphingopyxis sp.]